MIGEAVALFGLDPAEFVGERNRLVKLLKSAGRLEDSQYVAGLKRPKLAEYALNRLAHDDPQIVDRLIDAIEAASDAQSLAIGGQPAGLREATNELRNATKLAVDSAVKILDTGGGNGEGQRDDIVSLIRDVVGSGETDALRIGVIGAPDVGIRDRDVDDFFRGAPEPAIPSTASVKSVRPAGADKLAAVPRPAKMAQPPIGPSPTDRARRIQLERQLRDAISQVERSERAVHEAADLVQIAQAKLDERTAVLKARRTIVATAEAELANFQREWPTT